ncbi:MAG: nitrous oxide-stimulated promoter family protein [Turicibacter sp.]
MKLNRIEKEKKLIKLMIDIYCEQKHGCKDSLCESCQELATYADKRLTFCKFQNEKTSCRKCPVHCYKKDMKLAVKEVMKFSGPRLLIYRPLEFLKHWFY